MFLFHTRTFYHLDLDLEIEFDLGSGRRYISGDYYGGHWIFSVELGAVCFEEV